MALVKDKKVETYSEETPPNLPPPSAQLARIVPYRGVGTLLRQQRERLGYDLNAVCAQLRIRMKYLEALEVGDFSLLPGHIYVVGFLKSYADFLGLDASAVVSAYQTEGQNVASQSRLVFPIPAPETHRPKLWLVVLALFFAGLIYAGWYAAAMRDRAPAPLVAAPPQRSLENAPPTIDHSPTSSPLAEKSRDNNQTPSPVPQPVERAVAEPPPSSTVTTTPAPTPTASTITAAPPIVAPPLSPVAAEAPQPQGAPSRVTLRIIADSWVDIRGANNEVVFPSKVLHPGDIYAAPDRTDLVLWTGNLGGIEFIVDGNVIGKLGASGEPKRNLSLDPDRLLASPSRQH